MLTRFTLANPALVLSLLAAVLIFGPFSLMDHPSREDPRVVIRSAQVLAHFPGLSAQRVENLISFPMEEKIREIPEVETIETASSIGQSLIKVTVYDQYTDMEPIWQELRNKMADVAGELPQGTAGPIVFDDQGNVAMATVAITADGFSNAEMYEVAKDFRRLVYSRVPGVRKVDFYGVEDQRIYVEFDNVRIARLGLSDAAIIDAISAQNVIAPGGEMEIEGLTFTIEPMINLGSWAHQTWPDDWTAVTVDLKRSAQWEHTILVTETGVEILTLAEGEAQPFPG